MSPWIITLIVLSVLLFIFAICAILYYYALPKFLIHKMRTAPNSDGEMTYPEDYADLVSKVTVEKDLMYPSKFPSNGYNLYLPKHADSARPVPLIVWVHGGGFIGGSKDGGDNVMTSFAAAGFAVASIDYAVAPEYRYPTAVRQVAEFAAHLPTLLAAHTEIDGNRLVFGGDSAGAQIAAQYLSVSCDDTLAKSMNLVGISLTRVKAAVLICGPFHLPAIRAFAQKNNKMFRRVVDIWGRVYFGKFRWYNSAAALQSVVVDHVDGSFPPTFLTDGNKGSFEIQSRKLAEKLRASNVAVEELYFDPAQGEVPHEYLFHLDQPNSLKAMERMISFLNRVSR